jgi:hypothetical protein
MTHQQQQTSDESKSSFQPDASLTQWPARSKRACAIVLPLDDSFARTIYVSEHLQELKAAHSSLELRMKLRINYPAITTRATHIIATIGTQVFYGSDQAICELLSLFIHHHIRWHFLPYNTLFMRCCA